MNVSIEGLINRLESLRVRLNDLFEKIEEKEEQEKDFEPNEVERYLQNDDTFNLSIATDILEQAKKLDKVLEIVKTLFLDESGVGLSFEETKNPHSGEMQYRLIMNNDIPVILNEDKVNLLKEMLL